MARHTSLPRRYPPARGFSLRYRADRGRRRRDWRLALLLVFTVGVTAAACSSSDVPLVGTWRSTADDTLMEFKSDGTVVNSDDNGPLFGGKYRITGADTVVVEFAGAAGAAPAKTYKFAIAGDELTMTDEKGTSDVYRRD